MNNIKKTIYLVICIGLFGFTCSAHADTLGNVIKSGTLRVGVSLFEPWVMKNTTGDLYGFEIQIAEQLAKDLNVSPEFKVVEWEKIIDLLENKQVDIIIAGMAITPQRALRISFSHPYASSGIGIVANLEKTKDIHSLGELNIAKTKVGAVSGTVSEHVAKEVFYRATRELFVSIDDAKRAVVQGDVHVLVASSPTPNFLAISHPEKVDIPLDEHLLSYKTGMAVNKGEQEFLNYLNAWITAKEAERWLSAKHDYWFDSLQWKKE